MDPECAPQGSEARDPVVRVRALSSLSEIDAETWNALDHGPSPFLEYGFLRALELSGSIGGRSGWLPVYLIAEEMTGRDGAGSPDELNDEAPDGSPNGSDNDAGPLRLLGAVVAFVKTHSYGEYIFDWAWANASERAGIPYYPKLVMAAPVTPATGKRILLAPDADARFVTAALVSGVYKLADEAECSSIHWLFCTEDEARTLEALGFMRRLTYQFHWQNQGYARYDDFLAQLTSRKRKQLRKERRRALEALDGPVEFVPARELSDQALATLDRYYRSTVYAHGGMDYLRPGFFEHAAELVGDRMLFAQAESQGEMVAGAIFFETAQGLYGRYWGCEREIEFLHFETAYYAGIERCIERGIPLFEAGAQGEHKLLRGFLPRATHSCHWMRHPGLAAGIEEFLAMERSQMTSRMARMAERGPYRCADPEAKTDPKADPKAKTEAKTEARAKTARAEK